MCFGCSKFVFGQCLIYWCCLPVVCVLLSEVICVVLFDVLVFCPKYVRCCLKCLVFFVWCIGVVCPKSVVV